ncbi:MAG TPA: chorismate synthase [Wolbachia sp.]|uniref:HdaA/DnaA family protein n=1 Tax=Wolbachia endosymbiont of Pentalonia nigronervosa TaxID=1301914 RepID=UPI000EBD25E7|nr:DnaA/Hda family protein [Wolbachia endosymbiont of Pentalonia nigronervosa]MBD0392008.1 chorismate synthase [Wolbachia endosymbiont of Pentalonia nigronervosa]HCE59283.1 chorismate synthase [Wolbachia sp.]
MQLNLFNNNQVDYSQKNYIILDENKSIYNLVICDLSWQCLILFGPKSSGKTHLAHIWQSTNDAIFINTHNFISDIRYSNAFILEDIQNIRPLLKPIYGKRRSASEAPQDVFEERNSASTTKLPSEIEFQKKSIQDETTLLHCYNYMKENNKRLLITSSVSPKELNFQLRDLSSRILSTASAKILPASEELLKIMLIKKFADRQLKVDLKIINYILTRIERSFHGISKIVEEIDNKAIGANITIPFVSSMLSTISR